MTLEFMHGVTITEKTAGVRPIQTPPTCLIALVCTAPVHLVDSANAVINKGVLILNTTDAAKYAGPDLPGYTGPNALAAIQSFGAAKILMINVFDPAKHKTSVASESITLGADGTATLAKPGVITATIKNQAGSTTYTNGTDYTLDPITSKVSRVTSGTIAAGATLTVAYEYGDPSKVTAADIVGGVDVTTNLKTGMEALLDAPTLFNMKPRVILAPGFCTQLSVSTAMLSKAQQLRAHALIDAPIGTTELQAISGRGPSGTINFQTSSSWAALCYPHVQVPHPVTSAPVLEPFSQNLAGLASFVDLNEGYWMPWSNRELPRIIGTERPIQWSISDRNCMANQLNAVGIVTCVRGFGTGFRAWGSRSAAWPTDTTPKNYINVRIVDSVLFEALERASLPYIDGTISKAQLDAVKEDVNLFLSTLVGKKALMGGVCTWTAEDNAIDQLTLGKVKWKINYLPPIPLGEMELECVMDTAWMKTIYVGATA